MSKIVLYEGLVEELDGLTYEKEDGTTGRVNTVALWRNQPFNDKEENPVKYEAVFIEFLTSNHMESSSKAHQTVDMTVRLHCCYESYKVSDLDLLRFTAAVYSAIQLKQWGYWGVMKRRNEEQSFDHNNIQDFIMDFDAGKGKDYGADKRPTTPATITDIDITVEKVDEIE